MFKFWQQCELHVKEVAIGECVPQTSGLRKKGEGNYANNSNLYVSNYNKVDK